MQWRIQRGIGGSNEPPLEPKLFHFHGEFQEKIGQAAQIEPPSANLNPRSKNPGSGPVMSTKTVWPTFTLHYNAIYIIWATSWENLFMTYANNKGADQPAHPRSLISAFVVRCLDSIIPTLAKSRISRLLTSLCSWVLPGRKPPNTCFLVA